MPYAKIGVRVLAAIRSSRRRLSSVAFCSAVIAIVAPIASFPAAATAQSLPPAAPTGLTATAGDQQVTLSWDDPGDSSITVYRYRQSTDGGRSFTDHSIAGSGASTTSYTVTGLTNDTAYTFEIQARNIAGWSRASADVIATPLPPPDAPAGLTATAGNRQVTLDWANPNDSSITVYRYRQSVDGGGTFTDHAIAGSGASTTSHSRSWAPSHDRQAEPASRDANSDDRRSRLPLIAHPHRHRAHQRHRVHLRDPGPQLCGLERIVGSGDGHAAATAPGRARGPGRHSGRRRWPRSAACAP